jgi:hypothetical protein
VSFLEPALAYSRRGWSVIPIGRNKKAAVRWKKYQLEPADEALIRDWYGRKRNLTGVGIIFGDVSGGLLCRDFDTVNAYEAWKTANSDLAAVLPTVRTGRGYHVYCQSNLRRIKKLGDGELKGGGYCVAPPSIHPSGSTYTWVIPLPVGALPFVDASRFLSISGSATESARSALAAAASDSPSGVVTAAAAAAAKKARKKTNSSVLSVADEIEINDRIRRAITATAPRAIGRRNAAVFRFCRYLKAMPDCHDAPAEAFRNVLVEWHRQARPYIRTKPFDETWTDFCYAWPRVAFPHGQDPFSKLWEKAMRMKEPDAAARYDCPKTRKLICLCDVLQEVAGEGPFFVACRKAGELIGLDPANAWRRFRMLETDGLLEVVQRGTKSAATRYRYRG